LRKERTDLDNEGISLNMLCKPSTIRVIPMASRRLA